MDESAARDVLNEERAATLARIRALQADLDAIVDASANANTDDEHDPEGATIAYERAQVAALLAGAQSNLGDLNDALDRLSAGTIGSANDVTPRSRPNVWPRCLPEGPASSAPTRSPEHLHKDHGLCRQFLYST
jgi:hypothetical protein